MADGLNQYCKTCWKDFLTKWKRTKSGRLSRDKTCAKYRKTKKCKESQRKYWLSEKGKQKKRDSEQKLSRKLKKAEYAHEYRQTEKGKLSRANYFHKRRIAINSTDNKITLADWRGIKKQYKYKCIYCGEKKPLTMDHIIPLSKGGEHVKSNIVPACRSCNAKKGAKIVLLQILASV
jgi:5-methylcytosine-specific restriction endonuclease McrA